jgi:hypothetical protein
MRPNPLPTQLLMGGLSSIIANFTEVEKGRTRLQALKVQLDHDENIYGMKTTFLRHLLEAMVTRKVDALENGFKETLALYSEHSRHFMALEDKYAEKEMEATNPLMVANTGERIREIKSELKSIRAEAFALYQEMNRVLLLIGGTMPAIPESDRKALGF